MISGSDLARLIGISRQAVSALTHQGKLPSTPGANGRPQYDETSLQIQEYITTSKAQRRRAVGARSPSASKKRPPIRAPAAAATVPASDPPPPSERGQAADQDEPFGAILSPGGQRALSSWRRDEEGGESFNAAERRKKIADADMAELKAAERRGELVPRSEVDQVFNQCWAVDASQLLTISQRIAADLAAIFGVDDATRVSAAQEKLDFEIRGALGQSKRLLLEWLEARAEASA